MCLGARKGAEHAVGVEDAWRAHSLLGDRQDTDCVLHALEDLRDEVEDANHRLDDEMLFDQSGATLR
mgnify:CR=1 FL=1